MAGTGDVCWAFAIAHATYKTQIFFGLALTLGLAENQDVRKTSWTPASLPLGLWVLFLLLVYPISWAGYASLKHGNLEGLETSAVGPAMGPIIHGLANMVLLNLWIAGFLDTLMDEIWTVPSGAGLVILAGLVNANVWNVLASGARGGT